MNNRNKKETEKLQDLINMAQCGKYVTVRDLPDLSEKSKIRLERAGFFMLRDLINIAPGEIKKIDKYTFVIKELNKLGVKFYWQNIELTENETPTQLNQLGLPQNILEKLVSCGYRKIEDLSKNGNIKNIPGIGPKAIECIENRMCNYGLVCPWKIQEESTIIVLCKKILSKPEEVNDAIRKMLLCELKRLKAKIKHAASLGQIVEERDKQDLKLIEHVLNSANIPNNEDINEYTGKEKTTASDSEKSKENTIYTSGLRNYIIQVLEKNSYITKEDVKRGLINGEISKLTGIGDKAIEQLSKWLDGFYIDEPKGVTKYDEQMFRKVFANYFEIGDNYDIKLEEIIECLKHRLEELNAEQRVHGMLDDKHRELQLMVLQELFSGER